ncbi:MAG: hypothetical protein HY913_17570 [Desulfomonile tiedjei]|nr:hypothetical protein [Desulfomonile tiedjei]
MILDFRTNNLTTVETLKPGLWRIVTRFDDNLFSAEVALQVKAPALNITMASLEIKRDVMGLVPDLSETAQKLIGVRVGPGMTKIVRAIVGDESGSDRVAELVLEAMEMLVNGLTVPELRKAMSMAGEPARLEHDGPKVFLNEVLIGERAIKMMADNPRLKDSCAAFRDL